MCVSVHCGIRGNSPVYLHRIKFKTYVEHPCTKWSMTTSPNDDCSLSVFVYFRKKSYQVRSPFPVTQIVIFTTCLLTREETSLCYSNVPYSDRRSVQFSHLAGETKFFSSATTWNRLCSVGSDFSAFWAALFSQGILPMSGKLHNICGGGPY